MLLNTIGCKRGYGSSDTVLFVAHLDSATNSPGATDDGSGVAVLLETARALTYGTPFRNTVVFLFTDDEESGSYSGAKAFIDHHAWARNVRVVVNFDAGGISGPGGVGATSAKNAWLIRQLAQADRHVVGSSVINALAVSNEDFSGAFRAAGFSG